MNVFDQPSSVDEDMVKNLGPWPRWEARGKATKALIELHQELVPSKLNSESA